MNSRRRFVEPTTGLRLLVSGDCRGPHLRLPSHAVPTLKVLLTYPGLFDDYRRARSLNLLSIRLVESRNVWDRSIVAQNGPKAISKPFQFPNIEPFVF